MVFGFGAPQRKVSPIPPAAATMSAYQPTLRDRAAIGLINALGGGHLSQDMVEGLMGSRGMGTTRPGVADFIPLVGQAFQADEAGRQIAKGHPIAGLGNVALAAIPAPAIAKGAKVVSEAVRGGEAVAERVAPKITAYHGSPHAFDKFDAAKIGTGEGAQAYGHGLYFAESEDTARAYRDALRGQVANPDRNARLSQIASEMQQYAVPGQYRKFNNPKGAELAAEYDRIMAERAADKGHMYQVGINAHPDHFLDWDKPLNQQPLHVRQRIGPLVGDESLGTPNPFIDEGVYDSSKLGGGKPPSDPRTAEKIYRQLGDKASASAALQQAGIPGIKYLDQGSRTAGDGTRNYVVFDPANIDILKRYGLAATLMGGAGAAAATAPSQPAQAPTRFGF